MPYRPIRNAEDLARFVVFGETAENRWLEFKARYEQSDDAADELARDIAQFANTDGGTLLVGIAEERGPDGRRVASEGPGVDDVDRLKAWLEQAVRNHLVPSTFMKEVVAVDLNGKAVLAVNVPPSIALVALSHSEEKRGIEYLYRTETGKQRMNPAEVERHLMNGTRASRLALQRIVDELRERAKEPMTLVPPIVRTGPVIPLMGNGWTATTPRRQQVTDQSLQPRLKVLGEHEVEIELSKTSKCFTIPYSLIRDAWITVERRPGLVLSVRIVVDDERVYLEPID